MAQFLDAAGVRFLWNKILAKFVTKDGDKVLSDNNFTDEEKEKLSEAATMDDLQALKDSMSSLYSFKGTVPTLADLDLIENPENGDVYDVTEDGNSYVWNGDHWEEASSLLQVNALTDEDLTQIVDAHS